jgi:hypothetical protein
MIDIFAEKTKRKQGLGSGKEIFIVDKHARNTKTGDNFRSLIQEKVKHSSLYDCSHETFVRTQTAQYTQFIHLGSCKIVL